MDRPRRQQGGPVSRHTTPVLGGIISQLDATKPLGSLTGWPRAGVFTGVLLSGLAVLAAGAAVIPLLGSRSELKAEHMDNHIYFGHLRHWTGREDQLADAMATRTADAHLQMVARQNVAQGRRNWLKHQFLRAGMLLGAIGSLLVIASYVMERGL